jgi:hypothetical protein
MAEAATEPKVVEPTAEPTAEEIKAAKRKEIEEKIAVMKLQQLKEEEQKTAYFGEHPGITCDGCGVVPMVGYRYRCKSCANHDVCEMCWDAWGDGRGTMVNGLGKQTLSSNPADHSFKLYKDKSFKPLVKGGSAPKVKAAAKTKPNDPCTCASGKKFKKCCGAGGAA